MARQSLGNFRMNFPFVSRGRYQDMRERAYKAEERLDSLLNLLKVNDRSLELEKSSSSIPYSSTPDQEPKEEYPLPPPVEDAIRARVPRGSQQEGVLVREARAALERLGPDFDADSYAESIRIGTRVNGWPV